jgi:hypothetical protein
LSADSRKLYYAPLVKARVIRRLMGVIVFLALAVGAAGAGAADKEAVTEKVTALNRTAVAAYGEGDFKKTKSKLLEALALGKEALAGQPMLARTYLHLGVLYVEGLDDHAAGLNYFRQALAINPAIQITEGMATKTVTAAFEEAKKSGGDSHPAAARKDPTADDDEADVPSRPNRQSEKESRAAASADDARAAKAIEIEKRRAVAEVKELESQVGQSRADKDKLQKQLAETKASEAKERAEKERLQSELRRLGADAKKQLLDAEAEQKKAQQQADADQKKAQQQRDAEQKKAQEQALAEQKRLQLQADKERADRDKLIADGLAREKKEREAKEKAEKAGQDKDKLLAETRQALAEAKQRIQQLEKDKADRDKTIADGLAREKKERDAKEKLEHEKQAAAAREAERKARDEKERVDREKLAAGPDVPSHFSEPIYCDVPEVAPPDTDLYVHCLAQPHLKARTLSFFYRNSGNVTYNALVMEKSKRGWYMAMIPAARVSGRVLQYYAEARDGREAVAATNGKPSSPNILTLRTSGHK